jgi:two-component system, OmpR family, sensor kinase
VTMRPRRIFWRIYLHGLLLLLVVAGGMAVAASLVGRPPMWRRPERAAGYAARRIADLRQDPERLRAELERVRDAFGMELTVFTVGGEVVASSADEVPPPLDPAEARRLADGPRRMHRHHRFTFVAPVPGEPPAYVLASGLADASHLVRPAAFLTAVLLALALGSIPLARAISSPLERLTAAARALGRGDLSARSGVRRRDEVGELALAFDDMAERLERLVRSEKELLANVSHELRTPIARIRVALELAAEGDLEKARRFLGEIGADLAELELLVEEVLTAARLDLALGKGSASALPVARVRLDGAELVRAAAERFRSRWPERQLALEVPPTLPQVEGDLGLLRRAVENLLDNARKYSDPAEPVTLAGRVEGDSLVVEVRDRGRGIPPEDLPRLFTPFFRGDASRARDTGGVGLGLTLARRIAEAHGGTVRIESRPGQGTVAQVVVPAAALSLPEAVPRP